jgi:hypothetical protein
VKVSEGEQKENEQRAGRRAAEATVPLQVEGDWLSSKVAEAEESGNRRLAAVRTATTAMKDLRDWRSRFPLPFFPFFSFVERFDRERPQASTREEAQCSSDATSCRLNGWSYSTGAKAAGVSEAG